MANKKSTDEMSDWPIKGKTVALANGKRPPTVDGVIHIGMEYAIRVPSEKEQLKGFTPYETRGGKAFDMTQPLLAQYPGVYKPVKEKGD